MEASIQNAKPFIRAQQVVLGIAVLAMVATATGLYFWLYRASYVPLYSNLNEEDAASVLNQLDEMGVPFRLSDDGNAILVDSRQVGETRIRLDGSNLGIRGGEGFELFDNADFGMTEYVQKINYQRALQGELSRTIVGLSEVRYARVHLVIPEDTLFRNDSSEPKASVTLVLEPGLFLTASQVSGIQQLIASAVDGMTTASVTLLDERGLVLSQQRPAEGEESLLVFDSKQEVESYLGLKANRVLAQLYPVGAALVNIDVSLSRDQVQLTREFWHSPEEPRAGGIVAQSRTQREYRSPAENPESESGQLTSEVVEVDYRIDKSVEQIVKGSGAIERMTVSVMIPVDSSEEQVMAVRQLIASAVGLQPDRGDEISVFAMPNLAAGAQTIDRSVALAEDELSDVIPPAARVPAMNLVPEPTGLARAPLGGLLERVPPWVLIAISTLCALALLLILIVSVRRSPSRETSTLTAEQRQALLAEVRSWLEGDREHSTEAATAAEGS